MRLNLLTLKSIWAIWAIFICIPSICKAQVKTSSVKDLSNTFENAIHYEFDEQQKAIILYTYKKVDNCEALTIDEITALEKSSGNDKKKSEEKSDDPLKYKFVHETFLLKNYVFPVNETNNAKGAGSEFYTTRSKIEGQDFLRYYGRKDDAAKKMNVGSIEDCKAKYPKLNILDTETTVWMSQEGEGKRKDKNYKSNVLVKREITTALKEKQTLYEQPNYDKDRAIYKNMSINDADPKFSNDEHTRFISIQRAHVTEGWGAYMNFYIYTMDDKGNVLKMDSINKKYLKTIEKYCFVYNERGEKTGVLIAVSNQASFKKSLKDPISNNYHIFYTDFNGNIKISQEYQIGSTENDRGFKPIMGIEKEGTLKILNIDYNQLLKPVSEVLEFAPDKTMKRLPHTNLFDMKVNFLAVGTWDLKSIGNKLWLNAPVFNSDPNVPYKYSSIFSCILDPQTLEFSSKSYITTGSDKWPTFDLIDYKNDKATIVSSDEKHNYLMTFNNATGNIEAKMQQEKDIISYQICNTNEKSYVIDKIDRMIYFISGNTRDKTTTIYFTKVPY